MKAIDFVNSSNEWTTDLSNWRVLKFIDRYPWTLAFLILFVAMLVGIFRIEHVDNDQARYRGAILSEMIVRDRQFCDAIPNSAEAAAMAHTEIMIQDALDRGPVTAEEINRLKALGDEFAFKLRRLVIEDLPQCQKVWRTPRNAG